MIRLSTRLATVAAGLALATTMAAAQLPTVKQVQDRYVEALGGRAAIENQGGRHILAIVEVAAQGISAPIEIWATPPNKFYTATNIPGLGEITSGYDGETAWSINPAVGPTIMEGRALDQLRQQTDLLGVLHPEKYLASSSVTQELMWEGKTCYELKIKTTWGEEYTEYYDKATGLLHGTARSQESPMGALQATTLNTDYKAFGGVLSPMLVTVKVMGIEQVVRTESVELGPVPDSIFALPAAIKALKKTP